MIVLFKCFQSHGFKRKTGPPSAAGFSAGHAAAPRDPAAGGTPMQDPWKARRSAIEKPIACGDTENKITTETKEL